VLKFDFFDAAPNEKLAYVTFKPLTLHADREIWDLADKGEPYARFIIAHEIGHLLLHDHFEKGFSAGAERYVKSFPKEYSAEWQANTFASYFLLPTHLVEAFGDTEALTKSCGVLRQLAEDRVKAVYGARSRAELFSGDACCNCGNFTVQHDGRCLKCCIFAQA
jgi:hypothetical protein